MPKISALPLATGLTSTELVPVVQGLTTVQSTVANVRGGGWVNIKDYGAVGSGAGSAATDLAAFTAFRVWARLQGTTKIKLIIPPGDYTVAAFDASWFLDGVKHITVEAYGAILRSMVFGSVIAIQDTSAGSKLINTVSLGSTTVTCTTASDASLFAAGDWVYISCIDIQGYGSPPNNHIFEYQQVVSADSGTGIITLNEKLANSYRSTYPAFNVGDGNHPHNGGPGMVYLLHDSWDCENYIYGGSWINGGQFTFKGRYAEFKDCEFSGPGWAPTASRQIIFDRCKFNHDIEADKCVELVQFTHCEVDQIISQSSGINKMVIDGCHVATSINGTTKNTVIRNTDIPQLLIGPLSYGIMESLYLENCTIAAIAYNSHNQTIANFTVANGVITIAIAALPLQAMTIPGTVYQYETNGQAWKILDVTQSSTNYLVKTTLPEPVVTPASQFGAGGVVRQWVLWNSHFNIVAVNCRGCKEAVDLSNSSSRVGKSYLKRYLAGDFTSGVALGVGLVERITIKVIRAYTGAGTLTLGHTDYAIKQSDQTGAYESFFTVNLKIAGTRVITPTGNTGAQSGDTLKDLSLGYYKTGDSGAANISKSTSTSGETMDKQPIVMVEWVLNQGDVVTDNWQQDSIYIG